MEGALQEVVDFGETYAPVVGLVVTWSVLGVAWLARRRSWQTKRFTGQVNFSLNYADGDRLVFRTLLELPASSVWATDFAVRLVARAADAATPLKPFLCLRNPVDMAYVQRSVKNVLSERCADAYIARAVGEPVAMAEFLFGLTFEKYRDIRTQKLRVLLVSEGNLDEWFGAGRRPPDAPGQQHADRLATLLEMHRLAIAPGPDEASVLGRVELGVASTRQ